MGWQYRIDYHFVRGGRTRLPHVLVVTAAGSFGNSGPNVVLRVVRSFQVAAGFAGLLSLQVAVERHRFQRHGHAA
tara:strand:- start:115 stop:339 length:225 start_codon:yes stop_codon:yes gene_type:complete